MVREGLEGGLEGGTRGGGLEGWCGLEGGARGYEGGGLRVGV